MTPASFPNGKVIMSTTWVYGNVPGATFSGTSPFGLSVWKCLVMDDVRFVMFKISTLLDAIKQTSPDIKDITYDGLRDLILKAAPADISAWIANGAEIQFTTQGPYEVIYCPAGWLVAEHAFRGTLIYGCRKSVVYSSDTSASQYEALINLYKKSKKEVAKMEAVLQAIKVDLAGIA